MNDQRIPPQAIEAEQSLLGGLMIGGESAWDRVADAIAEGDFYLDAHRRIFAHMRRLAETGKPVDLLTVLDSIDASSDSEATGGLSYLGEIAANTASAANISSYAKIIVEKSQLRGLMAVAEDAVEIATRAGSETAQEKVDECLGKFMALADGGASKTEPRSISAVLAGVMEDIDARFHAGGEISGLKTGFADLDAKMDGMKPGDLIIVAGRPSMGKTALAINIAEQVALAETPAMVFSLEMADTQLATRSLSSVGGINGRSLASGRLTDEDWHRLTVAVGKLHVAPLVIDQTASLTAAQMHARARRQKRKNGLGLIVIDYLQLMSAGGNNRNEELSAITRALKLMARDLNVPVICLSQLSRKVEERADKRPLLSDLRESGSIEQDADVVLMLYRDDYYNENSPYKGVAEVIIRKNRMGECGEVKMVFQPEYSRFRNADHEHIAQLNRQAAEQRKPVRRRGLED